MFSSCKQVDQYVLQMVPSESIEQIIAWVKYLPLFIKTANSLLNYLRILWRCLLGRSVLVLNVSDVITPEALQALNILRGLEVCCMEWGEDISYLIAAFLWLPICQRNIFNSFSPDSPSTTDVLICLFLITVPFEHIVSVIGITALKRSNIIVSHQHIPLFNEFNSVGARKTSKSLLYLLVCWLCMTVILIALGEA